MTKEAIRRHIEAVKTRCREKFRPRAHGREARKATLAIDEIEKAGLEIRIEGKPFRRRQQTGARRFDIGCNSGRAGVRLEAAGMGRRDE
jgi:hypothetical protein